MPDHVMRHPWSTSGHPLKAHQAAPNHVTGRKTSLAPATKRAKMFLDQGSPTRCSYYEARLTGIPVRAGEGLDGYDGAVRPDDVPGVDASSGFEVIGRAPRETAGERSGLDGQPDDHLADAAELGSGESVSDLDLLEKDRGLCRMFREFEPGYAPQRACRALEKRSERRRSVPSDVCMVLERFHGVRSLREAQEHLPAPNGAMKGLRKVNADLVGFAQSRSPQTRPLWTWMPHWWRPQAGGAPQLQEVQGVQPLIWSRVDRAFGVSGRQRTCGPSAVASVD